MSQTSFLPLEWLNQVSDPYAVLGLSVTADDQRVLKRYRTIAKRLHPDSFVNADSDTQALAQHLLSRFINPAYQRVKQEKGRSEVMAMLRLWARRLNREENFFPTGEYAHQLLKKPFQDVDVFYEQAIDHLANAQLQTLTQFEAVSRQLGELNLLYLHLKMGEPLIREKRSGLVAATQAKPAQFTPPPSETAQMAGSYAQRHYNRALEYARKGVWVQVVAETRDAIRLEPTKSEYHSLLAKAYLMQKLPGMAKVHFRQALKFNPNDPLALQYAARLNLEDTAKPSAQAAPNPDPANPPAKGTSAKPSGGGLFNLFAKRK